MTDGFTRTPTGMVGSRYFVPVPIVWVEGPTDIYFYEPIVANLNCTLKPFHGVANATALVGRMKEDQGAYPYAVIIDGDYEILKAKRSSHRWLIRLRRYSIENYLWEEKSLNLSCLKHAQCGEKKDIISSEFNRIEADLKVKLCDLVEADIAARRSDPSPDVLPKRVDSLLLKKDAPDICPIKVARLVAKAHTELDAGLLAQAKKDVSTFLKNNPFSHLLNGHVLFGVIQRVFVRTSAKIRGTKVILNDDGLAQLLAEMVWRTVPSKEHSRLRRKVISVVKELNESAAASRV